MANVGEISASMVLDATDFGSGLAHASTEVRTFGHTVDSVGSTVKGFLTGFAAYKVGGFIVDIARDAAKAEEAVNGLAVMFGSRATDVEVFSRKMADEFHISINDILDAESRMGSIFQGAGLDDKKVAEYSKNIGTLAVDYARLRNTPIDTSFQKMLSGLAGEPEPLRAFGIFLDETAVKAKGLAMGLGDVSGELSAGEKIQARYALIMEKGAVALGTAAREAGGAAAQIEALSGEWANFKIAVGEVVAPHVAVVFGDLTSALAGVRKQLEWFQGKDSILQDMLPTTAVTEAAANVEKVAAAVRSLPTMKDALKLPGAFDASQWAELDALRSKKPTADFAAAAMRNSTDAASTIFRTKFGGGGKAAEKTEVNTRTTAANTAKLIEGVSVMTGKLEALKSSTSPDW